MKTKITLSALAAYCLLGPIIQAESPIEKITAQTNPPQQKSVADQDAALMQVALLLDTSGSMSGLINQARSQLWNVVAELSKAERQGQKSRLEIAVYQYGMKGNKDQGYLRQVIGFSDNLDDVSAALFSLTTGGGDEYCGQVIKAAVTNLEWSDRPDVYKVAFIAGNESFDQGSVSFGEQIAPLNQRNIVLNSIYCGSKQSGAEQWQSAAGLAGGVYAFIDHNHHLPEMKTPYDEKMRELNREMNGTFVWFGEGAEKAAKSQQDQDSNASKMSDHAYAARMSAKIGHLYHHVHHDLVDAMSHGKVNLASMPESQMPEAVIKLAPAEREKFMEEKTRQRQAVRRKMADVISKRHQFLEIKMAETMKQPTNGSLVLGNALANAIRQQAERKGYLFAN